MANILEIGGGRNPYFIRYKVPLGGNDAYVAVDIDDENIKMAEESIHQYFKDSNIVSNIQIKKADASAHVPYPDNYFDKVVISNTLSAPIHKNWDDNGYIVKVKNGEEIVERKIRDSNSTEDPFYIERKKMIDESLRVLKVGGELYIYTDLIIYGIDSYERIIDELKEAYTFSYVLDKSEGSRIDTINKNKILSNEFCCCFRAEVLPRSEVHRIIKV